jgi:phosphate acyltransferase
VTAPPARPVVVLDAMGGDDAPHSVVAGAVLAAADGIQVVLVGAHDPVTAALEAAGGPPLPVVDAAESIGMGEEAAVAVRAKRDASIRVAVRLVAEHLERQEPVALVSAGSTGATLAAVLLDLGRVGGVRRPVIGAVLPPVVAGHGVVLVDAGASPDVQPEAIVASARMGVAYAQVRGVDAPRVGLLNVGEEPGKGNALARAAHEALAGTAGFVGNVEPGVVLGGGVDVVVTDGFTGNVFLKTVEAVAARAGEAGSERRPGAAVLLGAAADVLVAHGAAGPEEIRAALRTAETVARGGLARQITARLGGPDRDRVRS